MEEFKQKGIEDEMGQDPYIQTMLAELRKCFPLDTSRDVDEDTDTEGS